MRANFPGKFMQKFEQQFEAFWAKLLWNKEHYSAEFLIQKIRRLLATFNIIVKWDVLSPKPVAVTDFNVATNLVGAWNKMAA